MNANHPTNPPELSPAERRRLRAAAHHLQPVVSIAGNGLTPAVLKEIDISLKSHELIKVKLHGIERAERDQLLAQICTDQQCAAVQHIGNILILWRPKPEVADAPPPARRRVAPPRTKKQAAAALEKRTKQR
jgi:putative YhbY family RNA-binding protein